MPNKDEIVGAIKKLRNNKAPGVKEVHCKMIKYGSQNLIRELETLIKLIWKKEKIPDQNGPNQSSYRFSKRGIRKNA